MVHIPENNLLSDFPPRKRDEILNTTLRSARLKLDDHDRELIDREVENVKTVCAGTNLGNAGALELLAKLGQFLSANNA